MGFKNTIEIITKDIQELEKMVRNFENNSPIPSIDLDLVLDKTRNLYELLLMIRDYERESEQGKTETAKDISPTPQNLENQGSQEKPEQPPIQNPPSPSAPEDIEFLDHGHEEKEGNPSESHENKLTETPENKSDKDRSEPMDKILAEKFQRKTDFINEKIGGDKSGHDLSSRMQSSPIKSISSSMGINDKFFFIRELFGGNAENFRQTMKTLDDAANFDEAHNFLSNTFEWDMESPTVQQLLNLIRRKFISA